MRKSRLEMSKRLASPSCKAAFARSLPTTSRVQMVTCGQLAKHVPDGVGQTSADPPQIASCPRLALQQLSKSLFPALVEGDPSVRKPRRLPRQPDDRLSHLAAIGERHQKKAFIAFLLNLDLGRGLRHGNETQLAMSGSSCKLALTTRGPVYNHRICRARPVTVVAIFALVLMRSRVRPKRVRDRWRSVVREHHDRHQRL
jgi:hypothetical protein